MEQNSKNNHAIYTKSDSDNLGSITNSRLGMGHLSNIMECHRHPSHTKGYKCNYVLVALCILGTMTIAHATKNTLPTFTMAYQQRNVMNISERMPEYWKDFRDWVHITTSFGSFWQKYAYCIEYQWYTGCDQFRKAVGSTYHLKTYMLYMNMNATDLEEQNPLKCHWIELWANKTSNMAIYSTAWKSWNNFKTVTLKVNNKYRTMAIQYRDFYEENKLYETFTCGMAMNTTYPRTWFAPMIAQAWQTGLVGNWYNKTSEEIEEQDYSDLDYSNYSDKEGTTITTPDPCRTTISRKCAIVKEKLEPNFIRKGIPNLPEPWGQKCPNSFLNSLNETVKKHNILCVSEFPNLPFYGNLTPVDNNGNPYKEIDTIEINGHKINKTNHIPKVTTKDTWDWSLWSKVLALGVEHWRFPIILTSILPQPWGQLRTWITRPQCLIPTHTCYYGQLVYNTSINGSYPWTWLCLEHNPILTNTHGFDEPQINNFKNATNVDFNQTKAWTELRKPHQKEVIFVNDTQNVLILRNTTEKTEWYPIYNGTNRPIKNFIINETQTDKKGIHICAHYGSGLDEYPIPYDIKSTLGTIYRPSKVIAWMNQNTTPINITEAYENITYKLPEIMEYTLVKVGSEKGNNKIKANHISQLNTR